jgi:hypothetical protein
MIKLIEVPTASSGCAGCYYLEVATVKCKAPSGTECWSNETGEHFIFKESEAQFEKVVK